MKIFDIVPGAVFDGQFRAIRITIYPVIIIISGEDAASRFSVRCQGRFHRADVYPETLTSNDSEQSTFQSLFNAWPWKRSVWPCHYVRYISENSSSSSIIRTTRHRSTFPNVYFFLSSTRRTIWTNSFLPTGFTKNSWIPASLIFSAGTGSFNPEHMIMQRSGLIRSNSLASSSPSYEAWYSPWQQDRIYGAPV